MRNKTVADMRHLEGEIDRLAHFIIDEMPGEPSQSEGAVDTAIRLLRANESALSELRQAVGLATTMHPKMRMDALHPLRMMQQIVRHVKRTL